MRPSVHSRKELLVKVMISAGRKFESGSLVKRRESINLEMLILERDQFESRKTSPSTARSCSSAGSRYHPSSAFNMMTGALSELNKSRLR